MWILDSKVNGFYVPQFSVFWFPNVHLFRRHMLLLTSHALLSLRHPSWLVLELPFKLVFVTLNVIYASMS